MKNMEMIKAKTPAYYIWIICVSCSNWILGFLRTETWTCLLGLYLKFTPQLKLDILKNTSKVRGICTVWKLTGDWTNMKMSE